MRVSTKFSPLDRIVVVIAHLALFGGSQGAFFFMLKAAPEEELAELMDIVGAREISLRDLAIKVYYRDWMPEILPRLELLEHPVIKQEVAQRFEALQSDALARMLPALEPVSTHALPHC
jgi:hypothetical protein